MALFDVVKPRIIELGKIKIGGLGEERQKRGGGSYRLPIKLDHFVITTLHRDGRGGLIQDDGLMTALKGEGYADSDGKLRRLPIAVLSNDIEDVLQAAYVRYNGKRIEARSDGVTLEKFFAGGKWLDEPHVSEWKPEMAEAVDSKGVPFFKMHATFNCVIASKAARWGGVYKFRTTSGISASQLAGSLVEIKQLTGGVLRGMPLRLAVRPLQVSPNGQTTTVYVVHCELVGDDLCELQDRALRRVQAELTNAKQISMMQLEYKRLIHEPGEGESDEEVEEIAAEFHPPERKPEATGADPLAAQLGIGGEDPPAVEAEFVDDAGPVPPGAVHTFDDDERGEV